MFGPFAILLIISFCGFVAAELNDHWGASDKSRTLKTVLNSLYSKDSSSRDVFYSLQYLLESGSTNICDCEVLKKRLSEETHLNDVFYMSRSNKLCSCSNGINEKILSNLEEGLLVS